MEKEDKNIIEIETLVDAPVEQVWDYWTLSRHMIRWNAASPDWCTTCAENDLRPGGNFHARMEARDGSFGFDFRGTYTNIIKHKLIEYKLEDGRMVKIEFEPQHDQTHILERFEPEQQNALDLQKTGWQAILDSFKRYAEKRKLSDLLVYDCEIKADHTKVFRALYDPELYRQWTVSFNPSSRYEGKWERGATIRFLGEDHNGKTGGMISKIREHIPDKFISIEHLGMVDADREIMHGSEVDSWKGVLENYTLSHADGRTLLIVDLDPVDQQSTNYFNDMWPKALHMLKSLCEKI